MTKNIFFHNIIRKFRNISISSKIIFLIIVDAMLITSNGIFLMILLILQNMMLK